MDRFLRYTTQKKPAPTASFLPAVLLAIAARYLGLTDEDLAILGPVMLIVAGVRLRLAATAGGGAAAPARLPVETSSGRQALRSSCDRRRPHRAEGTRRRGRGVQPPELVCSPPPAEDGD
jgi:hypothetical protein